MGRPRIVITVGAEMNAFAWRKFRTSLMVAGTSRKPAGHFPRRRLFEAMLDAFFSQSCA